MPVRTPLRLLALTVLVGLVAACTGGQRLSSAMASINRDYNALQDEALLLNILRRSADLPAHFTSLSTIRGFSRVDAGADLRLPFGGDAASDFAFNPHLSIRQGPAFDVSTQNNQEFYRGYVAPVDTKTLSLYLRQNNPPQLILSLFIERVRITTTEGDVMAENDPDDPRRFEAFQRLLNDLIAQGLTMEDVSLVSDFGPPFESDKPPSIDQMLSVRKEKMVIEAIGQRHYQLREIADSARFCFRQAQEPLFRQAHCSNGKPTARFDVEDPKFFGSVGARQIVFDTDNGGRIELRTRSLAEIFDYLGELVRHHLATGEPLTVDSPGGAKALIVVTREDATDTAAVSTEFAGRRYAIPGGADRGHSGAVLSIVSQLLAQAQSVEDLPVSRTITIVGE